MLTFPLFLFNNIKMRWFEITDLVILVILLVLVIAIVLGALYAYQWVLYYIDVGEQYIANINDKIDQIQIKIDDIRNNIPVIESSLSTLNTNVDTLLAR